MVHFANSSLTFEVRSVDYQAKPRRFLISYFKILTPAIIFTFFFINNILCQDYLESQFANAENLYNKKEYFDAITEFKRLLFFDSLSQYSFQANFLIGKCYKGGAKFTDAIKYFSIAANETILKIEKYQAKIEIIRCNILRRTTNQAILLLDQLQLENNSSVQFDEINYWRGWAYMFADEWGKAAESFGRIDDNHQLKIFSLQVEEKKYSLSFARLISYILPGFGQFYTGNYLSGLMSLGWTGLFAYLSVKSFQADRFFDGLLTTGLFFRFHRGNVQNAEKFAQKENLHNLNEALFYLQKFYIGEKP